MKLNLFILAVIILFYFSCKRGNDDSCGDRITDITYKNLTATSLERTKYFTDPAFDTIKFKSSKGDTLIWVKTDCDTTWFDDFKSYGVPGCPPYLNEKNMQITNYYRSIKGDGDFRVKHSLKDFNKGDYIVEINCLGIIFNFFERHFERLDYPNYIGDLNLNGNQFYNVFFIYESYKPETGIKGFMSPGEGLILISDSLNSVIYEIIK